MKQTSLVPLMLAGLVACTAAPQHPLDRHLSQLRPETVTALPGQGWPPGTLLCPLTLYQSALPAVEPMAERVNAFLKRRQYAGDEGHWTLVVIKPGTAGDDGIEHLTFKRRDYDVVNEAQQLKEAAGAIPEGFHPQSCVAVEWARVLATRARASQRTLISFGTGPGA